MMEANYAEGGCGFTLCPKWLQHLENTEMAAQYSK